MAQPSNSGKKPNIQVDCFEVGLGASVLLQFRPSPDAVVRVLADGGVGGAYKHDHVLKKLAGDVFSSFSECERKLDLIIATHYDGDHLKGLVPIIDDPTLQITEIWLPPVQKQIARMSESRVEAEDASFVSDLEQRGDRALLEYLDIQVTRMREVDDLLANAIRNGNFDSQPSEERGQQSQRLNALIQAGRIEANSLRVAMKNDESADNHEFRLAALAWFERARDELVRILRVDTLDHASADGDDADDAYFRALRRTPAMTDWQMHDMLDDAMDWWPPFPRADGERAIFALGSIKKASIQRAIVATHLANVVAAIRRRPSGKRIKVSIQTIDAGTPRYFRWDGKYFTGGNAALDSGLGLHLMAPSSSLVAKLHRKLPIGVQFMAFMTNRDLASDVVTESNRLSYVVRFELGRRSVLIAGDSGFSDFAPGPRKPVSPALLALLADLDVVQVAHHGGHCHRFYRALNEAKLWLRPRVYFLLSHAVKDKKRPRPVFSKFLALYKKGEKRRASVLFTSQPRPKKVAKMKGFIHPIVPKGSAPKRAEDVRIVCTNKGWKVERHGISA